MSMTIIKRSGEEVEFDISKIAAAIMKAFESIQPEIDEAVQNMANALSEFAERMAECTASIRDNINIASPHSRPQSPAPDHALHELRQGLCGYRHPHPYL